MGNGKTWGSRAAAHGVTNDGTPAVGAVAVATLGSFGHVALITGYSASTGRVTIEEYNKHADGRWDTRTGTLSGLGFSSVDHYESFETSGGGGGGGGSTHNGQFISYNGSVYRIAGGAPIYVSTWNAFHGPQSVTTLTAQQFSSLANYPADGTFISTINGANGGDGSVYRVAGGAPIYVSTFNAVGGTPASITQIDEAAIDNAGTGGSDNKWNHLRTYPADGTFISTINGANGGDGSVYRVAGGAPIYVSTFNAVGGTPASITQIDEAAIDNAGTGGSDNKWNHLRTYPADGTFISTINGANGGDGSVYRVAGGAPIYVSTFNAVGGTPASITQIDEAAIDNAGTGGSDNKWNHLRTYPADGTFISTINGANGGDGSVYRVAGGAPIYVSTFNAVGGTPASITQIDEAAIDNAGTGGSDNKWNHLRTYPADGTFISTINGANGGDGSVYRVAGGAPIYVSTFNAVGGTPASITQIDEAAIDNAGTGGSDNKWNHLRTYPADGTFISTINGANGGDGSVYRITGGAPNYAVGGTPASVTQIDQAAIDNAGTGGSDNKWNHLRRRAS